MTPPEPWGLSWTAGKEYGSPILLPNHYQASGRPYESQRDSAKDVLCSVNEKQLRLEQMLPRVPVTLSNLVFRRRMYPTLYPKI
jgi:hypothetical protein